MYSHTVRGIAGSCSLSFSLSMVGSMFAFPMAPKKPTAD